VGRPRKETLPAAAKIPAPETRGFVLTWDELARVLSQRLGVSVSRKSLQNWRNPRARPDLQGLWPACKADGRKDVDAWMRFILQHGLNRADELLESDEFGAGPDGIQGSSDRRTVRDWKMYREELACTEAERRIARGDGLLLVATELEVPLGATLVAVQTKLSQFAPRVARFMVNLRDEPAAEDKLRYEMDAVLTDLNLASYIDGAAEDVARLFPFNEECADLCARVSFAGQDRSLFVELIQRCVTEALRSIGARALSNSESESIAETTAPGKSETPEPKDATPPSLSAEKPKAGDEEATPQT
jgi:hypothetical protein